MIGRAVGVAASARWLPRVLPTMARATLTGRDRPDRLLRASYEANRWAGTMASGFAISARRFPDAIALKDESGALTYRELWSRSEALAAGLRERGIAAGDNIGLLCRNHRGFVEGLLALIMLEANVYFLNTGSAASQLAAVVRREEIDAVLHDAEYIAAVGSTPALSIDEAEIESLASGPSEHFGPPRSPGRAVIMTSGTTGHPRGVPRGATGGMVDGVAFLQRLPLRARQTIVITNPLFHGWGLAAMLLGSGLSSTLVLRRRFEPEEVLAAVDAEHAQVLTGVPVMFERLVRLEHAAFARYDVRSLRVVASSGAALGAPLAERLLRRFGPVIHSIYGSTEVALATVARPRELTAAPATAGRPLRGVLVEIVGPEGEILPRGERGRVFVANRMRFDGYTGGGAKEIVDGMLSSGDMGYIDATGLLFIDGREDDMVVSGGENVYPSEVEALLIRRDDVEEVAVFGVPDEEFGQRLRAVVVPAAEAQLTEEGVREYVRARLATYLVPREVIFLEALPRNATGKVLLRELRELQVTRP
jgi:acyl-CoA synthetase (AMP-forming)/AMP-acid ligase II